MKITLLMNVRGRKDLTRNCLLSLGRTIGQRPDVDLIIVDGSLDDESPLEQTEVDRWLEQADCLLGLFRLLSEPGCTMSSGLNIGFAKAAEVEYGGLKDHWVIVINNDVIFNESGWLEMIEQRAKEPGIVMLGSGAMSVFGHPFVTGATWGVNLWDAFSVSPDRNIMEPSLQYAYSDVALSIRLSRVGVVTHIPGLEWGEHPKTTHLVSQTVYSREGYETVMEYRRKEAKIFIDKYGRRDGKTPYEDI